LLIAILDYLDHSTLSGLLDSQPGFPLFPRQHKFCPILEALSAAGKNHPVRDGSYHGTPPHFYFSEEFFFPFGPNSVQATGLHAAQKPAAKPSPLGMDSLSGE
jgi:hypothetical protein